MIRLLIADDHATFRDGLKQFFAAVGNIAVVGEAADGTEVLEAIGLADLDLLLLDLTMPGPSGVQLVSQVHSQQPTLPILVLSMHNEPAIVKRALKSGASGYLTKDSNLDHLLAAVRLVAAGGRYIDPILAERADFEIGNEGPDSRWPHLSKRDIEILHLLENGLSVVEIAETLAVTTTTVNVLKARLARLPK
jgi:DNA-binding NarL/FixJ family response regulator